MYIHNIVYYIPIPTWFPNIQLINLRKDRICNQYLNFGTLFCFSTFVLFRIHYIKTLNIATMAWIWSRNEILQYLIYSDAAYSTKLHDQKFRESRVKCYGFHASMQIPWIFSWKTNFEFGNIISTQQDIFIMTYIKLIKQSEVCMFSKIIVISLCYINPEWNISIQ